MYERQHLNLEAELVQTRDLRKSGFAHKDRKAYWYFSGATRGLQWARDAQAQDVECRIEAAATALITSYTPATWPGKSRPEMVTAFLRGYIAGIERVFKKV